MWSFIYKKTENRPDSSAALNIPVYRAIFNGRDKQKGDFA
jgi:hypothetical protein